MCISFSFLCTLSSHSGTPYSFYFSAQTFSSSPETKYWLLFTLFTLIQQWLSSNSPERNLIIFLSRQAAQKKPPNFKLTTQFLNWQPNFKIEIKLQIEDFTATQNLNADLGRWCYWLSFRLPPSPQWLDRMLAVTLVSTLVVGLLRAILGLGTWDLGTP